MEKALIRKLTEVGKLLYAEGLVDARAGNLSSRLSNNLLITRRGSHLGRLTQQDFLTLPLSSGSPLEDRASSELPVHRQIYRSTPFRSVVHAHPTFAVLLSCDHDLIKPIDSEGESLLGEVRVIPSYPSGSEELAQAVADSLRKGKIVVVRSHGVFSADSDPLRAYEHISVLERSCRIIYHRMA